MSIFNKVLVIISFKYTFLLLSVKIWQFFFIIDFNFFLLHKYTTWTEHNFRDISSTLPKILHKLHKLYKILMFRHINAFLTQVTRWCRNSNNTKPTTLYKQSKSMLHSQINNKVTSLPIIVFSSLCIWKSSSCCRSEAFSFSRDNWTISSVLTWEVATSEISFSLEISFLWVTADSSSSIIFFLSASEISLVTESV